MSGLRQQFKRVNNSSIKKKHRTPACCCRGMTETKIYLQWPITLYRRRNTVHRPPCPHAAYEDALIDLELRFSMCSIALKKKVQLAIALSCGAASSRIQHSLQTYRVVQRSSRGFSLIRSLENANDPSIIIKCVHQIVQLFENRHASPYDRLADGSTLLHVSKLQLRHLSADKDFEGILCPMSLWTIYCRNS